MLSHILIFEPREENQVAKGMDRRKEQKKPKKKK